ncbi:MAG: 50S ribosomal protein L25/general stress protein Ctc [Bacteroidales bacterium]|nr:50S ribosomal protein L25/general stress protein Ctc [Bacteroidales bacterium]
MKTFELKGTLRNEYGKKAAKTLRQQDLIPCNLYGNGENVTFTVTTGDVRKLIYTPDTLIVDLTVGEKNCKAIVKELQFHPVTEQIFHIDFLEVTEEKPVVVNIPIQLTGHAEGVKAGGKLSLEMRKLKVRGIYTNFPDRMTIDVTELGLGKKLSVGQLHFDNLELANAKNQVVVQVKATRASAQAAPAGKK